MQADANAVLQSFKAQANKSKKWGKDQDQKQASKGQAMSKWVKAGKIPKPKQDQNFKKANVNIRLAEARHVYTERSVRAESF